MIDLSATPLVDVDWLEAHMKDPTLRIVDARWRSRDSGKNLFASGHIPGAVHLSWDGDITRDTSKARWIILPPADFAAMAGAAGIGDDTRVIAYTGEDDSAAGYLWWALRYCGYEQVAILDGGLTRWLAEKKPVATQIDPPDAEIFTPRPQKHLIATTEEIKSILNDPNADVCFVDTRPPEQFKGSAVWTPQGSLHLPEGESGVTNGGRLMRGGRLPGAIHQHAVLNLDPDKAWSFKSREVLRQRALDAGVDPEKRIITYCGCGISASLGLFALHLAGFENIALFDASWEEWGTDASLPIERDE